jgi:hypothetical protein
LDETRAWFLSETALFDVPTSELWRAVVFESDISPGYIPAVGMDAFQDVDSLSAEATDAHKHDRARLAELFMQGSAHPLLLHRHVSDASQSTEEAPLPPAHSYVSDLERRKTRERQARRTARDERVRSYRAVPVPSTCWIIRLALNVSTTAASTCYVGPTSLVCPVIPRHP